MGHTFAASTDRFKSQMKLRLHADTRGTYQHMIPIAWPTQIRCQIFRRGCLKFEEVGSLSCGGWDDYDGWCHHGSPHITCHVINQVWGSPLLPCCLRLLVGGGSHTATPLHDKLSPCFYSTHANGQPHGIAVLSLNLFTRRGFVSTFPLFWSGGSRCGLSERPLHVLYISKNDTLWSMSWLGQILYM